MASQRTDEKATPATRIVTTSTGRIMRVNVDATGTPVAGTVAPAVAATPAAADPSRRADVLFRVRRDEGHEPSVWWMIGAFVVTSGLVILLLSGVPGIA